MAGAGIRLGIMAAGILRIGMADTGAAGMPAIGGRGIIRIRIGEAQDGITVRDILITGIHGMKVIPVRAGAVW